MDRLDDGDVIITFNWDNLVERALHSHSKGISFLGRESDSVAVLKLHGSLNWVSIPEGIALKEPDFVPLVSGKIARTPDYRYYDVWNVLDQPPLIIPPVTSKNALVDPFFRELWDEAFSSIVDASSVAFIGYSIPPDDLQARGLFTISWLTRNRTGSGVERFTLIDPSPEVCGRYAAVVGTSIDFRQTYFSEEDLQFLFSTPLAVGTEGTS